MSNSKLRQKCNELLGLSVPSPKEKLGLLDILDIHYTADELFDGDYVSSSKWLRQPNKYFNGESPLDYARNNGPKEVLNFIGRLEHGVFT